MTFTAIYRIVSGPSVSSDFHLTIFRNKGQNCWDKKKALKLIFFPIRKIVHCFHGCRVYSINLVFTLYSTANKNENNNGSMWWEKIKKRCSRVREEKAQHRERMKEDRMFDNYVWAVNRAMVWAHRAESSSIYPHPHRTVCVHRFSIFRLHGSELLQA